jgi:hypothetical protein
MRFGKRTKRDTTTPEAMDRIDAWYKANPGQLDKPILSVIWIDIAEPRLVSSS